MVLWMYPHQGNSWGRLLCTRHVAGFGWQMHWSVKHWNERVQSFITQMRGNNIFSLVLDLMIVVPGYTLWFTMSMADIMCDYNIGKGTPSCPVSCRTVSDQCSLLVMWTSKRQSAANHCFSWRRRWIYWGGVRRCLCLAVSPHSLSWGNLFNDDVAKLRLLQMCRHWLCIRTEKEFCSGARYTVVNLSTDKKYTQ